MTFAIRLILIDKPKMSTRHYYVDTLQLKFTHDKVLLVDLCQYHTLQHNDVIHYKNITLQACLENQNTEHHKSTLPCYYNNQTLLQNKTNKLNVLY